jgi:hypothetical protein
MVGSYRVVGETQLGTFEQRVYAPATDPSVAVLRLVAVAIVTNEMAKSKYRLV